MIRFRWPRGRYNGRRIVGFQVRLAIDLLRWSLSALRLNGLYLALGPLRLYFGAVTKGGEP